jgi:hypothetical protein
VWQNLTIPELKATLYPIDAGLLFFKGNTLISQNYTLYKDTYLITNKKLIRTYPPLTNFWGKEIFHPWNSKGLNISLFRCVFSGLKLNYHEHKFFKTLNLIVRNVSLTALFNTIFLDILFLPEDFVWWHRLEYIGISFLSMTKGCWCPFRTLVSIGNHEIGR